jgi:PIN domain nuclease of toxin-antitoxin system
VRVLDASALLAFLFREEGHERVERLLDGSCMSSVNLSEVISRFVRDGHDAQMVRDRLSSLRLEIVPFDDRDAMLAASLLPATRPLGLSLADRACLALALRMELPAVTADRAWKDLDVDVEIEVVR